MEDYRRALLDEEVNNSAATKLSQWKNVNQPMDPRNWFEKLLGLNPPGKVTKGVRKLREREASEGKQVVLTKVGEESRISESTKETHQDDEVGYFAGAGGRRLDDIQSVDEHSYPPNASIDMQGSTSTVGFSPDDMTSWRGGSGSLTAYQQSVKSRTSIGVVDYRKRTTGMARWDRTLWKKLEVGDIVLLRDNDQVPADIVVMSTSDPEGMCYFETKNLDGETNLKIKQASPHTANLTAPPLVTSLRGSLRSEQPNNSLYTYEGTLDLVNAQGVPKQVPLGPDQILLRGAQLRNTPWAYGLVVFTGHDTKLMRNATLVVRLLLEITFLLISHIFPVLHLLNGQP